MQTDVFHLATLASIVSEANSDVHRLHGIVHVDPVAPAGHYNRRRAACIDATDLLPSESRYDSYINALAQGFGPVRRFVLQGALVTGQGAILTQGRALLDETCWEFLVHKHVPHGLARESANQFRLTEYPGHFVSGSSLLLKRPWWRNYGHWLVDAAALIALLMKRRVGGFQQIVIGSAEDPKLRAIFEETLALVAPGIPVVEHPDNAVWAFSELHYVTPIRRPPMLTLPEAIEALRVAVLGDPAPAAGERRLFVSRRHFGRRRLENEAEVIDVCGRHGFEVVYPEQFSLREQAALFRSAAALAGVKGAALANVMFSPPDAAVIALSPGDFSDPFFWDIAGSRNLSYSEIFGPLTTTEYGLAQNPFTISPGRLDALLHKALSSRVKLTAGSGPAHEMPAPFRSTSASEVPNMSGVQNVFPAELTGEFYRSCLARIHAKAQPRTYLEIGTADGGTLSLSRSRSVAIDPKFELAEPMPGEMPSLFLFQGESDRFFETHDPKVLLEGPVDLAFLDGMHLFEFLLRDFINTERHCHRGSMVILHDCIPLDMEMTQRDMITAQSRPAQQYPGWWTGDVWKTVDILMRYRPDLEIIALDAPPTGLVVIRKLDPSSTVLLSEYKAIVDAYGSDPGFSMIAQYFKRLDMYPTSVVDWFQPIDRPQNASNPP